MQKLIFALHEYRRRRAHLRGEINKKAGAGPAFRIDQMT